MTLRPLDLGQQSNEGRYPHAGVARLTNLYCEQAGKEGRFQFPLWPVSGLKSWGTHSGAGKVRAMLATDTELYVVSGRILSSFDALGNETIIGGIPSDGITTMAVNRIGQVTVVCDGVYYLVGAGTVSVVTDAELPPPNSVCCVDGYNVLTVNDGRFYLTDIDDATSISGLDFSKAEANADGLLIGKIRGRDLALFGPRSLEIWMDTGGADFPLSRRSALNVGALNASAVVSSPIITSDTVTDAIVWAATDSQGHYAGVSMLNGDNATVISTPYIDRIFSLEPNQAAITGTAWTERGHGFVMFSGTDWSVVYDTKTGLWHNRESGGGRTRVEQTIAYGGKIIGGDYVTGALYELDPDTHDEAGTALICTVQTPPVTAMPSRLEFNTLYLDAIPGVGLVSGASSDVNPAVMMQYSEDGRTWSTERWRDLGLVNETNTRIKWDALGTGRQQGRTFRFRSSANVVRGYTGAFIDATPVKA